MQNNALLQLKQQQDQVNEALRESEERYQLIAKETGQLIYDYDLKTGKLLWGGAVKKVTGYDSGTFSPTIDNWASRIHPDDRKNALDLLDVAQKECSDYRCDYRLRVRGGLYKYVSDSGVFISDKREKPYRMLGVVKDITDKKESENALKESEERFRKAASVASDLIYEWDVKTEKLKWFGDIDKILGYPKDKFPRTLKAWLNVIHPDDQKKLVDSAAMRMISKKPLREEYRVIKKDGTVRYWTDEGTPIFDERGNPVRWIGACTDVTAHKLAEESIRESEERLRYFFENIDDLVQSVDAKGNFIFVNKKWLSVLGYTNEQALKMNFIDIIQKDHISMCKGIFSQLIKGEVFHNIDTVFITKNNKEIIIRGNAHPYIKNGKFFSIISIFEDVTEERRAEEEIQRRNDELERFNKLAVGRELKMIELKKRITELEAQK